MSDSVRPQRRQPNRLLCPWASPGKNTGVGCHFLLQCMKVRSESEVAQSCLPLSDPMDCSPPGPSVHGIFQARVLEWGAIAFSLSSLTRGQTMSPALQGRFLTTGPPGSPHINAIISFLDFYLLVFLNIFLLVYANICLNLLTLK